jgi:RNA polymerase subunit RPABC4/transcription elongation factor Spt4
MLKCPHCDKEIEGKACPTCGTAVPEESRYCLQCGASLKNPSAAAAVPGDEFDPDSRVLCPDGNCTGIIENGKCTECGKPYN